jgi:hypothetical protein
MVHTLRPTEFIPFRLRRIDLDREPGTSGGGLVLQSELDMPVE